MENFEIYNDIAQRTNGDIYVGVVGPVRTGKSTFISRFVNELVLPKMIDKNAKKRTVDEMPQSGAGKSIMTTQPKFVPNVAATISLEENINASVRLVDCVGYLIDDVSGHTENGKARLVKTPWYDKDIPFEEAAELGTHKVIEEHSTIAVVITTDGSIVDIPRDNYVKAEERVITELKQYNKPFVIVLNCVNPEADATKKLKASLEEKYNQAVVAVNVQMMTEKEIKNIFEKVLYEFMVTKINFILPSWLRTLPEEDDNISEMLNRIKQVTAKMNKMKDYKEMETVFEDMPEVSLSLAGINLGTGELSFNIEASERLFYDILSKQSGIPITSNFELLSYIQEVSVAKYEYDKLKNALDMVKQTGYGIVEPTKEDMELKEPQIIKKGSGSGVKLKAVAPSLHIMRVDVETEVCPALGIQGEQFISSMLSGFEENPVELWNTNIFGKPLSELAREGLSSKIYAFPEEAQIKMRKTLTKIINEGKGGIICILL